jgi:hypothetical protein
MQAIPVEQCVYSTKLAPLSSNESDDLFKWISTGS